MGPFGKRQLSKSDVYAFYNCLYIYLNSPCQTELSCYTEALFYLQFSAAGQKEGKEVSMK